MMTSVYAIPRIYRRVRYPVVPINSSLLNITLYSSVRITHTYNNTKYSVTFMTL
jgi:hypothetical protein